MGISEDDNSGLITVGLDSFTDKTQIKSKLHNYIPSDLVYDIHNFDYGEDVEWKAIKNKKFQVLIVEDTPEYLPFIALKASEELHKNRIYYRGRINTEEATHDEVKKIINRRLDINVSTTVEEEFKEHVNQLQILYSFSTKYYPVNSLVSSAISSLSFYIHEEENPKFQGRFRRFHN